MASAGGRACQARTAASVARRPLIESLAPPIERRIRRTRGIRSNGSGSWSKERALRARAFDEVGTPSAGRRNPGAEHAHLRFSRGAQASKYNHPRLETGVASCGMPLL